ncbi:hypothetical protein Aduo_014443 [Ancylostoma duodenale]
MVLECEQDDQGRYGDRSMMRRVWTEQAWKEFQRRDAGDKATPVRRPQTRSAARVKMKEWRKRTGNKRRATTTRRGTRTSSLRRRGYPATGGAVGPATRDLCGTDTVARTAWGWLISAEATTALYIPPIHGWPSEKIADTACSRQDNEIQTRLHISRKTQHDWGNFQRDFP